jgi:2-isopropylmalate synthase
MIPQYNIHGVKIYDATPREGFQTPGVGASLEERIEIVKNLRKVYGDDKAIIELGMPANEIDYPIVTEIMEREKGPQYGFLLRCHDLDVARAKKAFENYPNNLAHLFIGTSQEHRTTRFGGKYSLEDYCKIIQEKVREVAQDPNVRQVMFSPEDSTRTFWERKNQGDPITGEVLMKVITAAKQGYDQGNQIVKRTFPIIFNLPDTIGIGIPAENMQMIKSVHKLFGDSVDLSVHFHNDMDCASGETLDAVMAGFVKYPQVCFAGSGERNGIGKAEPVIVGLNERGIVKFSEAQAKSLTQVSRDIARIMGINLDLRYPVTGKDVNVSTSGIHAQAARKNQDTYHFMGKKYGNPVRIVFGTTSGTDTARAFLEANNYNFTEKQLIEYTDEMKNMANSIKNYLTETEMEIMAEKIINSVTENGLKIFDYKPRSRKKSDIAQIILDVELEGKKDRWRSHGVGPVDAVFKLLRDKLGYSGAILSDYSSAVKGIGEKASQQVMCSIDYNGKTYCGRGISKDVTKAPIDAVIEAFLNMHFLLARENNK